MGRQVHTASSRWQERTGLRSLEHRTEPRWSRPASGRDPRDETGSRAATGSEERGTAPGGAGPRAVLQTPHCPRPAAPHPAWAVGSEEGRALTHVLRVQLHGRHLLQRDVSRSAVPAAPQAAEHRGGHGARTTVSAAVTGRPPPLDRGDTASTPPLRLPPPPKRRSLCGARRPIQRRSSPGGRSAGRGVAGPGRKMQRLRARGGAGPRRRAWLEAERGQRAWGEGVRCGWALGGVTLCADPFLPWPGFTLSPDVEQLAGSRRSPATQ